MDSTRMRDLSDVVADRGRTISQRSAPVLRDTSHAVAGIIDLTVDAVVHLVDRDTWEQARDPQAWQRLGDRGREVVSHPRESTRSGLRSLADRGRRATERSRVLLGRRWEAVAPDYDQLTVAELRELARAADIPGRSSMHRDELIASLRGPSA